MEPQIELMDLIRRAVTESCGIDLCFDGTPVDGGICAELAPGYTANFFYDKRAIHIIPVLFLSKGKDQKDCADHLCRICNYFNSLKQYPAAENFKWLDAFTSTGVNRIGRQEDGQWIYSAVVNMKIYF